MSSESIMMNPSCILKVDTVTTKKYKGTHFGCLKSKRTQFEGFCEINFFFKWGLSVLFSQVGKDQVPLITIQVHITHQR